MLVDIPVNQSEPVLSEDPLKVNSGNQLFKRTDQSNQRPNLSAVVTCLNEPPQTPDKPEQEFNIPPRNGGDVAWG